MHLTVTTTASQVSVGSLSGRLGIIDWVVIFAGLGCVVEFPFLGRLYLSDVLLLLVALWSYQDVVKSVRRKIPQRVVLLAVLWLCAQVVTDIYRDSSAEDYLRGWAKIAFTISAFLALYLLLKGNSRRALLYGSSLAAGQLGRHLVYPIEQAEGDPWKWGLAVPVSLGLVVCATVLMSLNRRRFAISILLMVVALNVAFGFRSLALISAIGLAPVLLQSRSSQAVSPGKVILAVGALSLIGFGVLAAFEKMSASGYLGVDAQEKFAGQAQGEFGMLVGGRSEIFASTAAIADSPWIGHGSWARNPYYVGVMMARLAEAGYAIPYTQSDLIPSHSHLMGAWVEAGVCGAIFWVFILYVVTRAWLVVMSGKCMNAVLVSFACAMLVWDIPFSPYGADRRFITTYYIVLAIVAIESRSIGRDAVYYSPRRLSKMRA